MGDDLSRVLFEHFSPISDILAVNNFIFVVEPNKLSILKNEVASYTIEFH
jgi:hypothetical protein